MEPHKHGNSFIFDLQTLLLALFLGQEKSAGTKLKKSSALVVARTHMVHLG